MRTVDVAIIGAGLSGSFAAAMLGRAGIVTALIDPYETCRPDFRCEKLETAHIGALHKAGLLDDVVSAGRHYEGIWVARAGRLCERKPIAEYGIDYSTLVNRLRALVPGTVAFLRDKVTDLALSDDRQTLTLGDGTSLSARLVIAASGLNAAILAKSGLRRREISHCHSISYGFDVEPLEAPRFPFEALTYFGERPADRVSYITFFPVGSASRVNLFAYRDPDDPWNRQFRNAPEATIFDCLPRLSRLTGRFRVLTPIKPRPTDLYRTENAIQAGLVLVGDAYSTACPVSGTGASKALIDVERLCNVHVPAWVATPGMGAEKIAAFYGDKVKLRSDACSLNASLAAKRLALGTGVSWETYRMARFAGSFARGIFDRPFVAPTGGELQPASF